MKKNILTTIMILLSFVLLLSCSNEFTSVSTMDIYEEDNSEIENYSESTTLVNESESESIESSSDDAVWTIEPIIIDNDISPVVDANEDGFYVQQDGFEQLSTRLSDINNSIKSRYPNNLIDYIIYRCDAKIISIRVVVHESVYDMMKYTDFIIYQESFNLDFEGNDITLVNIMDSEGVQYIIDETNIDIINDDISWVVDMTSFCILTDRGVFRVPLNSGYFCSWLVEIAGEGFGLFIDNTIDVNGLSIEILYDTLGPYKYNNLQLLVNGNEVSIVPEQYGISPYWSGDTLIYIDENLSVYFAINYNGDWDGDRFLALYEITEEGEKLIHLEDNESMQNSIQDVSDIIEFGQLE